MLAALASLLLAQPLAYPGAMGFGRYSAAGRGGDVCHVTNWDDSIPSTPGSLRRCAEPPPGVCRTTVPDIGGYVHLVGPLIIPPCWRFAGEAGPAPGLTIDGRAVGGNPVRYIVIGVSDVTIRYLRDRLGDDNWNPANQATGQPLLINGHARRVLIDHSSFSWYHDDFEALWSKPAGYDADEITIQNSFLTEPLGGKGAFFASGAYPAHVSFLHNLVAHSLSRHPQVGSYGSAATVIDWSCNVVYNMGGGKSQVGLDTNPTAPIGVRVWGNVYKKGPNVGYMSGSPAVVHLLATYAWPFTTYPIQASLEHGANTLDGWAVDPIETDANFAGTWTSASLEVPYPLPSTDPVDVVATVLGSGGASLYRDPVDEQMVSDVWTRAGLIKTSTSQSCNPTGCGFPALEQTQRPYGYDTDGDGMPDSWELAHGYDPALDDHNVDLNADGWTALEDYLVELAP